MQPCAAEIHLRNFFESNNKKFVLKEVNGAAFAQALDLCYGKECFADMELTEIRELASITDQFQMTDVKSMLDETVMTNLNMQMCIEVLCWRGYHSLRQLENVARRLALERFEELAKMEGFMRIDEESLGELLEDDNLAAKNERA